MRSSTRAAKTKNALTVDVRFTASALPSSLFDEFDKKLQVQNEDFIAQLKQTKDRIMQCMCGFSAELCYVRAEYKMLLEKQNKLENKSQENVNEIEGLNVKVSALENNVVCSVAVWVEFYPFW